MSGGTAPTAPAPAGSSTEAVAHLRWEVVDPSSAEAQQILTEYFDDIVGRYWGRAATPAEVASAMADEPSGDLQGRSGLLLVGSAGGTPVVCGGVRRAGDGVGDLTRIFVSPAVRGRRLGAELVGRLERLAAEAGVRTLRLDVRADLVQARSLYLRLGYVDVPPFSDARYADHWMSRELGDPEGSAPSSDTLGAEQPRAAGQPRDVAPQTSSAPTV